MFYDEKESNKIIHIFPDEISYEFLTLKQQYAISYNNVFITDRSYISLNKLINGFTEICIYCIFFVDDKNIYNFVKNITAIKYKHLRGVIINNCRDEDNTRLLMRYKSILKKYLLVEYFPQIMSILFDKLTCAILWF